MTHDVWPRVLDPLLTDWVQINKMSAAVDITIPRTFRTLTDIYTLSRTKKPHCEDLLSRFDRQALEGLSVGFYTNFAGQDDGEQKIHTQGHFGVTC